MASKKGSVLTSSDFVHLHNHTQYSLLDGLTKIPNLIETVKDFGMQAVSITDHGTLSGVIEFYKEATSKDVKPLIGIETYIAARGMTDRDPAHDKPNFHLIMLAMNNIGYQNLMRLSSLANLEGMYYKPRIDHELLEKYNEGLIVLSGCVSGEVGDNLRQGQYKKAKDVASWYKKVFGDRYYFEVQDHGHPEHPSKWAEQTDVNAQIMQLGKELDIPCVLTCDAHYLKHDDQTAHEILLCVQTGSFLNDEKRMSLNDFELHVTDPKEIIKRWGKDHPDIIKNTKAIADRCNVSIELGKIMTPKFTVPKGETEKTCLEKLVWQGLAWRYAGVELKASEKLSIADAKKKLPKEVIERTNYELGTIDKMGFNGYLLIVQDFIKWGKDQGIVFGPGRGSAASSIVAYAVRITEIEPLKYDLMFERFLNPERISMPDIDIDIQDSRRNEVIQYCIEKYGTNRVANIVTFGRMAARNAVRDVARVLQVPYAESDRLAKMIPPPVQGRHIPLKVSLEEDLDLKREYETNETAKQVFDLATQLEGTIRSHGVHAAGVVIAPDEIVKFIPLEMAQKGFVATQYSMGPVDELGLLKIDFLGLSNLTIVNNALRIIRRVYKDDIDLSELPLDDPKTFELFQKGDTTGVFQFESTGMKRYLKELKPNLFEDLIAMNALYRPGPMQEIPRFIESKNNPSAVHFLHKSLEPVLKDTYGVMVYQEQITRLLQHVAGYTAGEADLVRKAIGKKKRDIMKAEEPRFTEGCIKKGLSRAQAQQLWTQIQPFADYSFNKAHATCYAEIAYWTAYLKAHYPAAFMAALMTSDYDDTDRLAIEITECHHMGIDVLSPDVNESFVEFAVVPGKQPQVRFGMKAIKNVGTGAVEEILRAREEGSFESLEDFLERVNTRIVNRKTLESLIKSGAFDRFSDRSTLLHNLDTVLAYSSRMQKERASGQTDLFGNALELDIAKVKLVLDKPPFEYSTRDQLLWERELLGLYISQHPLSIFENFLGEQTMPLIELKPEHENATVTVGGAINEAREITTKNGQKMAFVKLEDLSGELELVVFPSTYQQTFGLWQRDRVILARGKLSTKDSKGQPGTDPKVVIDDAREVTAEQATAYQPTGKKIKLPRSRKAAVAAQTATATDPSVSPSSKRERLYIRLKDSDDQTTLLSLKQTIDNFQGDTDVVLVMGNPDQQRIIKLPTGISADNGALEKLQTLVGTDNVRLS